MTSNPTHRFCNGPANERATRWRLGVSSPEWSENSEAPHPPEAGTLAPQLRAIDHTAVDPHDWAHLHHILNHHDLAEVTAPLRRAHDHRLQALLTLRRLTETDQRGLLKLVARAQRDSTSVPSGSSFRGVLMSR